MHRNPLLELIANYARTYPAEREVINRFISFVGTHPQCFDRQLATGHVTASAWVVNRQGTKVLFTHHRKLNQWLQLGGHADGQSDVLSVALQETLEESGLEAVAPVSSEIFDLDIHSIPENGLEQAHLHYDVRFALQATGSETYKVSAESHALAWVPIDALEKIQADASIQRMQWKWLASHPASHFQNASRSPLKTTKP